MHDPETFPDPMDFRPERYLAAEGDMYHTTIDPVKFAFGYGRR